MADYSKVANEEFDEAVRQTARGYGVDGVLDMPGVWECVSEHLNNEALGLCRNAVDDPEEEDESDEEEQ